MWCDARDVYGNRDSIGQQSKVWDQDFLLRKIFHYDFMVASQIDSQLYDTASAIDRTEEGTMQGRILEGNKYALGFKLD